MPCFWYNMASPNVPIYKTNIAIFKHSTPPAAKLLTDQSQPIITTKDSCGLVISVVRLRCRPHAGTYLAGIGTSHHFKVTALYTLEANYRLSIVSDRLDQERLVATRNVPTHETTLTLKLYSSSISQENFQNNNSNFLPAKSCV